MLYTEQIIGIVKNLFIDCQDHLAVYLSLPIPIPQQRFLKWHFQIPDLFSFFPQFQYTWVGNIAVTNIRAVDCSHKIW